MSNHFHFIAQASRLAASLGGRRRRAARITLQPMCEGGGGSHFGGTASHVIVRYLECGLLTAVPGIQSFFPRGMYPKNILGKNFHLCRRHYGNIFYLKLSSPSRQ